VRENALSEHITIWLGKVSVADQHPVGVGVGVGMGVGVSVGVGMG